MATLDQRPGKAVSQSKSQSKPYVPEMNSSPAFFNIPTDEEENNGGPQSEAADSLPSAQTNQSKICWVAPARATRLDGIKTMPLPAMDHNFSQYTSVTIVPGRIDEERFKLAVAKTLVQFPHIGARLENEDELSGERGKWQFFLNHTPVPITFQSSNLSSLPSHNPGSNPHPSLVDPLPWLSIPPSTTSLSSSPLAKWTITHLPRLNKTAITFHACRVLGDTLLFSRINLAVSDYYQGRSRQSNGPFWYDGFFAQQRADSMHVGKERNCELRQFEIDQVLGAGLGEVVTAYSERELVRQHDLETTLTEPITFTLTTNDLCDLRVAISGQRSCGSQNLSETDVLCAYLIRLFSEMCGFTGGRVVFLAPQTQQYLNTNLSSPRSSSTIVPHISPCLTPSSISYSSLRILSSLVSNTLIASPFACSLHEQYTLPAYTSLLRTIASQVNPERLAPLIAPPGPSPAGKLGSDPRWLGFGIDVSQLACASVIRDTEYGALDLAQTVVLPGVTERGFVRVVPLMGGTGVRIEARVLREGCLGERILRRVEEDKKDRFRKVVQGKAESVSIGVIKTNARL